MFINSNSLNKKLSVFNIFIDIVLIIKIFSNMYRIESNQLGLISIVNKRKKNSN
jgi:hypothetical protein